MEQDQSFCFELDLVATAGNTESLATLLCNNITTLRLQRRGEFRKLEIRDMELYRHHCVLAVRSTKNEVTYIMTPQLSLSKTSINRRIEQENEDMCRIIQMLPLGRRTTIGQRIS